MELDLFPVKPPAPEPKDPPMRVAFNVIAVFLGIFGFGLAMEDSHPYWGMLFMVLALVYLAWELFTSKAAIKRFPAAVRAIFLAVASMSFLWVSWPHIMGITSPKKTEPTKAEQPPERQDLSEIQKTLEEIQRNTKPNGQPIVSAAQMDAIKDIDRLILSRDETMLRQAFGFPKMMENNIRMNIAIVRHFKQAENDTLDLRPYLGTDWMINSELADGHVRRYGGGFQYDPPDGNRVYLLALPNEYTLGKKVLFKFQNSSELPTPILRAIKDLDEAVYKNADDLMHVLNTALKKDSDYYLRYDDQTSPEYFHQIDAMWLNHFVQLRPKADKIRDAIRKYVGVK